MESRVFPLPIREGKAASEVIEPKATVATTANVSSTLSVTSEAVSARPNLRPRSSIKAPDRLSAEKPAMAAFATRRKAPSKARSASTVGQAVSIRKARAVKKNSKSVGKAKALAIRAAGVTAGHGNGNICGNRSTDAGAGTRMSKKSCVASADESILMTGGEFHFTRRPATLLPPHPFAANATAASTGGSAVSCADRADPARQPAGAANAACADTSLYRVGTLALKGFEPTGAPTNPVWRCDDTRDFFE